MAAVADRRNMLWLLGVFLAIQPYLHSCRHAPPSPGAPPGPPPPGQLADLLRPRVDQQNTADIANLLQIIPYPTEKKGKNKKQEASPVAIILTNLQSQLNDVNGDKEADIMYAIQQVNKELRKRNHKNVTPDDPEHEEKQAEKDVFKGETAEDLDEEDNEEERNISDSLTVVERYLKSLEETIQDVGDLDANMERDIDALAQTEEKDEHDLALIIQQDFDEDVVTDGDAPDLEVAAEIDTPDATLSLESDSNDLSVTEERDVNDLAVTAERDVNDLAVTVERDGNDSSESVINASDVDEAFGIEENDLSLMADGNSEDLLPDSLYVVNEAYVNNYGIDSLPVESLSVGSDERDLVLESEKSKSKTLCADNVPKNNNDEHQKPILNSPYYVFDDEEDSKNVINETYYEHDQRNVHSLLPTPYEYPNDFKNNYAAYNDKYKNLHSRRMLYENVTKPEDKIYNLLGIYSKSAENEELNSDASRESENESENRSTQNENKHEHHKHRRHNYHLKSVEDSRSNTDKSYQKVDSEKQREIMKAYNLSFTFNK